MYPLLFVSIFNKWEDTQNDKTELFRFHEGNDFNGHSNIKEESSLGELFN